MIVHGLFTFCVQGLFPESHDIIDNTMYDLEYSEQFRSGSTAFEGKWWGGEPVGTITRWHINRICFYRTTTYFGLNCKFTSNTILKRFVLYCRCGWRANFKGTSLPPFSGLALTPTSQVLGLFIHSLNVHLFLSFQQSHLLQDSGHSFCSYFCFIWALWE